MKKSIVLEPVEQKYIMLSDFERKAIGYHSGYKCEKCGHELILRSGEYGLFLGCECFPKCTGSVSLLTDEDVAEIEYRRIHLDCQEDVATVTSTMSFMVWTIAI